MPFLRLTRDRRGFENTFLMHADRPGDRPRCCTGIAPRRASCSGRSPLDEDAIRTIEEQHPDIDFDWPAILALSEVMTPEDEAPAPRRSNSNNGARRNGADAIASSATPQPRRIENRRCRRSRRCRDRGPRRAASRRCAPKKCLRRGRPPVDDHASEDSRPSRCARDRDTAAAKPAGRRTRGARDRTRACARAMPRSSRAFTNGVSTSTAAQGRVVQARRADRSRVVDDAGRSAGRRAQRRRAVRTAALELGAKPRAASLFARVARFDRVDLRRARFRCRSSPAERRGQISASTSVRASDGPITREPRQSTLRSSCSTAWRAQ